MNLFKRNNSVQSNLQPTNNNSLLAELALNTIDDGVVITDRNGIVQYVNPAAASMTDCGGVEVALGMNYSTLIRLESKEGRELGDNENPLILAMGAGQALDNFRGSLIVGQTTKRIPISVSVTIAAGISNSRVITFRNIAKELEEEGAQTEFISTASHEMRTPVASIEGYLALALNPQTATIDARAQGYLDAAHKASQHLGKLFQDLLDVTKLDDGRIRPKFMPVEMVSFVKQISDNYYAQFNDSKVEYTFGATDTVAGGAVIPQVVYGYIDTNFMQEIMDNLLENALKYTPKGGSVYVNVRGDGDRVLINVTDTGIGISADDIQHIFQKFYRADNSDTREIGGTGLGLYLVKQRVEAMGGKIWAESGFGEGSTFFVSLPRLTGEEYEKRMQVLRNQSQFANPAQPVQIAQQPMSMPVQQPVPQPVQQPVPQSAPPQPIPQQINQIPTNNQINNGGQPI